MGRRDSKARRQPKVRPQGILELTAQGYGFVKTAEGEFFVPRSKTGGAFPGDLVELSILPSGQRRKNHGRNSGLPDLNSSSHRPEARVAKVIMRAQPTLIGRYEIAEPFGVVIPENPAIHHDIFTLRKEAPWVHDGDIVEVGIIDYPTRNSAATGRVLRVVGHADDPHLDVDLIIAEYGLETKFSEAALEQANNCELNVADAFSKGYHDCTRDFIYTIDPVDAHDFDDAVSCTFDGKEYHLSVHIADVSQYVPFDTPLDHDAQKRATSVYLVDRVLPMLPERISNNLCSLVPKQKRLALTVEARLTAHGKVKSYDVYPSVIESKARLSYEQALILIDAINDDEALSAFKFADTPMGAVPLDDTTLLSLKDSIKALSQLAETLFHNRYEAGCMDFDRVEARVKLDKDDHPVDIIYRKRTKATHAIEEAMILANELVAQWLGDKKLPCIYRVHDEPDLDGLRELYPILQELPAYKYLDKQRFVSGDPHTLQEVLAIADKLPEKELVNTLVLKSMKRALYQTEDRPHFGLALEHYCHFTSPIRRYPDLEVHRMVHQAIEGTSASYENQKISLPWLADHSSKMERTAEQAEQDSQTIKIIEYLEAFIGQRFEGVVSSVSTFGLTVRLNNSAKGLLPLDCLGDEYFAFDTTHHCLIGVDTGRKYALGQSLSVVIDEADHRRKKLTFAHPKPIDRS